LQLQHYIAFHLAFIACLASFMLGLGENEMFLSAATIAGAVASLWVTDYRQIFQIGPKLSNSLIVLIVVVALVYIWHDYVAELAVGIARVLVFVQIVVLFRKKTLRTRWHILLISFLQAIVATVFQQNVIFAFLMILYTFSALSTIVLINLEQDRNFYQENMFVRSLFRIRRSELTIRQDFYRIVKIVAATFLTGPLSLVLQYKESSSESIPENSSTDMEPSVSPVSSLKREVPRKSEVRWPSLEEKAAFSSSTARVTGLAGIRAELYARLAFGTLISLFVGLFVFFLVPRFEEINIMDICFSTEQGWAIGRIRARNTVGFSEEVRLGSLGMVSQSQRKVFDVGFSEVSQSGDSYLPIGGNSVYFRGVVLNHYRRGRWSDVSRSDRVYSRDPYGNVILTSGMYGGVNGSDASDREFRPHFIPNHVPGDFYDGQDGRRFRFAPGLDVVRMNFSYAPSRRNPVIFTPWPFFVRRNHDSPDMICFQNRVLRRSNPYNPSPFDLVTTAFQAGNQVSLTPSQEPVDMEEMLQFDRESFPGLARLARDWDAPFQKQTFEPLDVVARARNLERQLSENDRFSYVLGGVMRSPDLDPLEDFVRRNPQGHCEYFAGTLAMMLRSLEIPSRLVLGYKTEMLTPDENGMYPVLECDAHAWVEVYLPPESLPENLKSPEYADWWRYGGWLRLDPMPQGAEPGSPQFSWSQWKTWFNTFWSNNFLNFNPDRQGEMVYAPIQEFFRNLKNRFFDKTYWIEIGRSILGKYREIFTNITSGRWQGNDFVLICLPLGILLTLTYMIVKVLIPRFLRLLRLPFQGAPQDSFSNIVFYRKFELCLARAGLTRNPAETQREFARRSAAFLQSRMILPLRRNGTLGEETLPLRPEQVMSIPKKMADAFYRVRYGQAAMEQDEESGLNEELRALEMTVSLHRGTKKIP
jgi:hypothetical protein